MTYKLIDRATLEQLVEAAEGLMEWQVKNVKVWHNSAYDTMHMRLEQLRAALANAEPTGWQPIETAPATANNVLAFRESGSMKIETGFWLINMLHAAKIDGDKCNYTHWMPLPAPPKETT